MSSSLAERDAEEANAEAEDARRGAKAKQQSQAKSEMCTGQRKKKQARPKRRALKSSPSKDAFVQELTAAGCFRRQIQSRRLCGRHASLSPCAQGGALDAMFDVCVCSAKLQCQRRNKLELGHQDTQKKQSCQDELHFLLKGGVCAKRD